jgi:dihydroxy-acid dehydratase
VPHLVDVRPAGKFVMQDLDRVGGVPVVMKELLDAGLLNGDAITVTGKTIAQNLEELAPQAPDGSIVRPVLGADPSLRAGRRSCTARSRPRAR